jgi:hypothetical protein
MTTDVVRAGLTGVSSSEHNRYFYDPLTGRLDSSITIALDGSGSRDDLADIAALEDAEILDPSLAAVLPVLAASGFAWDYSHRSGITYNPSNAFIAGYTDRTVSSDAPAKVTTLTATDMAYDAFGRMTGRTAWTEERELSDNTLINKYRTEFSAPTYDALGRLTNFTQRTVHDADGDGAVVLNNDRTVTETVTQSFSSSDGRVIYSEKTIRERGTSGDTAIDRTYVTKTSVTAYDPACPALPKSEITTIYEGDRMSTDETVYTYDAATRRVLTRSVKTSVTTVPGVTDEALKLNSNSQASISYAGYDDLGRATGYTVTSLQNNRQTVQTVTGIAYDASGNVTSQASAFVETIPGPDMPDYRREWTIIASGQQWNKLGLMTAVHRETDERGKRTIEEVSGHIL